MFALTTTILLTILSPCFPEDCFNGTDDDGDGLIDLNDPDCRCYPLAEGLGPELIFNGGFEELSNTPDCQGCVSLFDSDGCPLGWQQESVNLHMPCFTSANPSQNIGYILATDNYQGVGGFGIDANNERQQEEFLQTALQSPLVSGRTYLFRGDFEMPSTTIPGINLASTHRLVLLGSSESSEPIDQTGSGCYEERPGWEVLGFIDVINRPRDNFGNYQISFIAPGPIDQLVITSACCQPELPTDERLTYYGVDNLSVVEAAPLPLSNNLQIADAGCDAPLDICVQATNNATYQWYQEGIAIANATEACLTLPAGIADGTTLQVWIQRNDNCVILDTTLNRGCISVSEVCDNGIDDDGDGLVDYNDPDCSCSTPLSPLVITEAYCPTTISLSVTLIGNETVQWYYNGLPLVGAVSNTLVLIEGADLAGQYFAILTEPLSGNCRQSEVFQPNLPDELSFIFQMEPPQCFNGNDGRIITSFTATDTNAYSFSWRTETGQVFSNLPSPSSLSAGNYQLEVNDRNGCSGIFNFDLPNQSPPSVFLGVDYDSCGQEAPGGILHLNSTNLNPPFSHFFFAAAEGDTMVSNDNQFFLSNGTYRGFTVDAADCRVDWGPIRVNRPATSSLRISASSEVVSLGATVALSAVTSANFLGWEPAELLDCPTCPNSSLRPIESVWMTASARDLVNGCLLTDSLFLVVDKRERLFIPNAFSPNFDGVNDRWLVFSNESLSSMGLLQVYDRWGNVVHQGEGDLGWDGRNATGQALLPGVYLFTLAVEFIDGSSRVLSGEILLIR